LKNVDVDVEAAPARQFFCHDAGVEISFGLPRCGPSSMVTPTQDIQPERGVSIVHQRATEQIGEVERDAGGEKPGFE
jgi:hypothetical protein